MNFSFSGFISYRHNEGDVKFLENFKKNIDPEAQRFTNLKEFFIDTKGIRVGQSFNEIYNKINSSYFFIPIYHFGYLHVENVWCARELYHAIEVEKIIRKLIKNDNYCYILPVLFRGNPSDLPECLCNRKVMEIMRKEYIIRINKDCKGLVDFRQEICYEFETNFKMIENNLSGFEHLCKRIRIPSDEEIIQWIKEQKTNRKNVESEKLPILKKNAK